MTRFRICGFGSYITGLWWRSINTNTVDSTSSNPRTTVSRTLQIKTRNRTSFSVHRITAMLPSTSVQSPIFHIVVLQCKTVLQSVSVHGIHYPAEYLPCHWHSTHHAVFLPYHMHPCTAKSKQLAPMQNFTINTTYSTPFCFQPASARATDLVMVAGLTGTWSSCTGTCTVIYTFAIGVSAKHYPLLHAIARTLQKQIELIQAPNYQPAPISYLFPVTSMPCMTRWNATLLYHCRSGCSGAGTGMKKSSRTAVNALYRSLLQATTTADNALR